MEKELFGAIRDNYYDGSSRLWSWLNRKNIFLKILFSPWVLVSSCFLLLIGFVFSLGVILDKFSVFLLNKRHGTIDIIHNSANNLRYSKMSYLTTPLKAILLSPIAFILGIIPKWSSTILSAPFDDISTSYEKDYGFFQNLGNSYIFLSKKMFVNISQHGYFFAIFALIITLITVPLTIAIALFFYIFIILDYVGWIVAKLRLFVVHSSYKFSDNIGTNNFNSFVMPILLVIFVPIYIFLLLIPKVATYDVDA